MQKEQIIEKLESIKMLVENSEGLEQWRKDETVNFIDDAISILNLEETEE